MSYQCSRSPLFGPAPGDQALAAGLYRNAPRHEVEATLRRLGLKSNADLESIRAARATADFNAKLEAARHAEQARVLAHDEAVRTAHITGRGVEIERQRRAAAAAKPTVAPARLSKRDADAIADDLRDAEAAARKAPHLQSPLERRRVRELDKLRALAAQHARIWPWRARR